MSSIRSILEDLVYQLTDFTMEEIRSEKIKGHTKIDQALKDISELIDGAKPNEFRDSAMTTTETNHYGAGYNHAIDKYQSNLKELLK